MLPGGVYDGRLFASPSIVAHLDKVGQILLQTSWFQRIEPQRIEPP